MIARAAALVAAALLAPAGVAAAEASIGGITIGAPIAAVAQTLGPPQTVASLDSGHRFAFDAATAYVDDDGRVLTVETRMGILRIDVDGKARSLEVGAYSLAQAESELADIAQFASGEVRSYRLAPRRDLVLTFSATANRLERIAYGEPGQLARLGLLPGDPAAKAVPYHAPVVRRSVTETTNSGNESTVYRLDVDRAGAVRAVAVIVPSALPAFDDELAARMRANRYAPATLGGRPIAASVFIEVHH